MNEILENINHLSPKGTTSPDYYIIGQNSSELEVNNNNPFDPNSGKSNSYLMGILNTLGINELNCRFNKMISVVSDNYQRIDESVRSACIESLKEDICSTMPKIIIAFGTEVGSLFLGDRCKYISRTRGRLLDTEINGVSFKIIVTYSPSYITKEYASTPEDEAQDMTEFANQFYSDINYACKYLRGELVDISAKTLKYAMTYDEFKEYFDENLKDCEFPSYDIESNAKDPRCADFRIVGYSLAPNGTTGIYVIRRTLEYDMPIEDWDKCVEITKDYLMSRTCLVHNIMYEKPSTLNEWGINITNFEDSLIKARLLLGGKTGAGLKDQCILNLGYPEWDADLGDYMYNFDILRYGLAHTPAGNHRWDYDVLVEKGFQGLLDTYNECDRIHKELSSKSDLDKDKQKLLESNTLDKRSNGCAVAVRDLVSLIYNYYSSDEVSYILDLIGKEVINLIDIKYEGILPYSSIPMKIITKYGAMDSVATHDLNDHLSKRMDNESTDTVNLWNGYRVMKEHFIVGSHLEMNGLFWNEDVAKSNWDWLAGTAKDSLRKCIMSGFLDDQIYENSLYLLNEHVQNNMMDYVEQVLGEFEMQAKGIKIKSTGKRISFKNLIWELPESFRQSMKPWVIEESKKRIMDDDLHPTYTDLKYIFNPASNKNTPILNKILVTKEIQIGYLIVKIRELLDSESFSMDSVPMPDKLLFKVIHDTDKYNKSEECTEKITSRQLFLKIDAALTQIPGLQSKLVIDIIKDAVSYKLDGTSEPVMLKLFDYYEAIGIDIEDESTYTPEFEFFFNFRMYKKCTKLISSYIDGGKIGRGSVWTVSREDIDQNKLEPIRTKRYDWNKEKDENEEYLMQPTWKVCFGRDTKILMADGSEKLIQDIQVGDEVLSVDEDLDGTQWLYNPPKIHSSKVTKIFIRDAETAHVEWKDPEINYYWGGFNVTMNHPFLSYNKEWECFGSMINNKSSRFVMYSAGLFSNIDSTELVIKSYQSEQVYNFETESHTYIANRFVVHNCTAETMRWQSGIHTLPMGRVVKGMYTSRYKGGVIAAPDYSQLEVRITAGLSKCTPMLEAYKNGEDVHMRTAMGIFGKPADQITKVERRFSKMGCAVGSTRILLPNGCTPTIQEIYQGNYQGNKDILSYNISENKTEPDMIVGVELTKYVYHTVRLYFDEKSYIECTPDHPMLLAMGSYKEAKDCGGYSIETTYYKKENDVVRVAKRDPQLSRVIIRIEEIEYKEPIPVYDLAVLNNHNYPVLIDRPSEDEYCAVFTHNTFRILYGSTPEGFARQFLDNDVEMARKIFDGFYSTYPQIKEWMDKRHEEVERTGKVSCENVGYFINIDVANDPEGLEGAYRKAGNYPIQSQGSMTAGYVLASINNYFMSHNMYTKPISFIHDSLEFDIHPKELFEVTPVILRMMNDIPDKEFGIFTEADVVLGTSMGMENEVKEMKFSDDGNEGWLTLEGFEDDLDDMYNHWKTESNYRLVEYEDIGEPEEVYIRKRELFQEKLALGPFLGKTRRLIQRKFHIIME